MEGAWGRVDHFENEPWGTRLYPGLNYDAPPDLLRRLALSREGYPGMAPTSPRGAPGVVGAGNTLTPDQVNLEWQ